MVTWATASRFLAFFSFAVVAATFESMSIRRHFDQPATESELSESLAFLKRHMPQDMSVSEEDLRANTDFACQARRGLKVAVPDEVYANYVLPFRIVDEPLDLWRRPFFTALSPLVADKSCIEDAVQAVIPAVWNTLRNAPSVKPLLALKPDQLEQSLAPIVFKGNQTPQIMAPISQTLTLGYASCTGLSILAVAALRSVGIPARMVGTPQWNTKAGGNHDWIEVWMGPDNWKFFDADPRQNPISFNEVWFVPSPANHAIKGNLYGISTPVWNNNIADSDFNITWRTPGEEMPALDRTNFYQQYKQLDA